jgi:hypothetical protein
VYLYFYWEFFFEHFRFSAVATRIAAAQALLEIGEVKSEFRQLVMQGGLVERALSLCELTVEDHRNPTRIDDDGGAVEEKSTSTISCDSVDLTMISMKTVAEIILFASNSHSDEIVRFILFQFAVITNTPDWQYQQNICYVRYIFDNFCTRMFCDVVLLDLITLILKYLISVHLSQMKSYNCVSVLLLLLRSSRPVIVQRICLALMTMLRNISFRNRTTLWQTLLAADIVEVLLDASKIRCVILNLHCLLSRKF